VAAGDRALFEQFRSEHVAALAPEREAQWGEALSQSTDASVASVLDALICGADAAAALRRAGFGAAGPASGRDRAGRGVAAAGAASGA
jgi:hypothetical protein